MIQQSNRSFPERLYLYLSLNEFGVRKFIALLNGKLHLTSPGNFNDPFDCTALVDISSSPHPTVPPSMVQAIDKTREEREWHHRHKICSFSEVHDSMLMWSHYANSHKGVCLELTFDPMKLPPDCFFEKVRYSTHLPTVDSAKVKDDETIKTFYLTKSTDWMYEKEWRIIAPSANYPKNDGFNGLIADSPFVVQRVLFGVKRESENFFDEAIKEDGDVISQNLKAEINEALIQRWEPEDYEKITTVLTKLRIDPEKDTVNMANRKTELCEVIAYQFFSQNCKALEMVREEMSFGVKMAIYPSLL
jgi:hypothetical protein